MLSPPPKGQTQSPTKKNRAQTKRKSNIDKIKQSMQQFTLIRKNHVIAQHLLEEFKRKRSDDEETGIDSHESVERMHQTEKVQLFTEKYEMLQKLGEGSNGVVHRCRKRENDQEFAVKSFQFEDQHLQGVKANFLALKGIRHPNIIKYEALYIDLHKHMAWLVMELVQSPSLNQITLTTEEDKKRVVLQLLDALCYLHKHDIAHRDIKPENILYDQRTKEIKLIDFGVSRRFRKRGELFDMWTITGTLYYRAPEMFSGGYREGVDVWAAGILLFKLFCGRTPFESAYSNQTIKNIVTQQPVFPPEFKKFSLELKHLISKMLQKDPEHRPSSACCLKSNWFTAGASHHTSHQESMVVSKNNEEIAFENTVQTPMCRFKSERSPTSKADEMRNMNKDLKSSVRPYIRKIQGEQFHCIDSGW